MPVANFMFTDGIRFRPIWLILLLTGWLSCTTSSVYAQVSPFNLLTNGDFESGGSGNGFQVPGPFNFLGTPPPLTGSSAPGDYAIIPNPQPMNTANFITGTDHSGTGKMLVVDGTTTGGSQRFWKAGSTGGGVGPLTVGLTYTFSYWKKSVSSTTVDASTAANISVAWGNASTITLVSGTEQVSFPGSTSVWQQVKYSFVPTSAYVNIELYNNNINGTGNDFAIDDVEVLAPPTPLLLRYSIIDPACPTGSDGSVTLYGSGGTSPYTYSFNASLFSATNLFTGLSAGFYPASVRDQAPSQVNAIPLIILNDPTDPLSISNGVTICLGQAAQPSASASVPGAYHWTANPPDATLITPNINSPAVSPTVTTTYTVTFTYNRNRNLIYNGDFSLGDQGFYTEYSYMASNPSGLQRAYSVTNNPNLFEPGFSAACTDHTNGSGNMLVVDGATNNDIAVWRQKVPVNPGTNYVFSYWLQTVALPATPASLEAQINGIPITGTAATSTLTAGALCGWVQYTYTWNSGANTSADIELIDRVIASSGNDFAIDDISFTIPVTCSSTKNVVITVNPAVTTGFSYTTPVCANAGNQSPTLVSGFTTGGTFSSSPGLSINSSTGVINVVTSTPGTYTVTYTVGGAGCAGGGTSNTSITITPNTTPVTGFSYASPVCTNAGNISPTLNSGFTTGGTFSSTAGLSINNMTGIINASASTAGTYVIQYNIASIGCQTAGSGSASITISSSINPVTGFSYSTPVCANAGNITPSLTAGFTPGGVFSAAAGLSINSSTGAINTTLSTPGTYTISYNIAANGCQLAGSSTATITINPNTIPVTTFSYNTPVCSNAASQSPVLGGGFTPGGIFSSTAGLSINASTGVIDVATSTAGTYSISYTVAASGCQLAASGTASITINPIINPVTGFMYASPVCSNAINQSPALSGGFSTGGTFASTPGLSISPASGQINVSASTPGTYTVTYTIAASGCQLAGSGSATITISSTINPVTGFSYTTPICANAGFQSPVFITGFTPGGSFSSSAGLSINPASGVINAGASIPGTYTVNYSIPQSGCQLAGNGTASITINPNTTPGTGFGYTTPICANAGNQSPIFSSGFTAGGTFSSTAGLTLNTTTGIINPATSSPGTYIVTYTIPANGCQLAGVGNASITINPTIIPVTGFSYPSPVCSNAANQSPILSTGFTAGGTFSSSAGLSIDPATGLINVAASTPGTYTVSYSIPAINCQVVGNNTASITITSTIIPVTSFSYSTPVCSNAANLTPALGAGFTTGGSFSAAAGLTLSATTGVITVSSSTPGTYTVSYSIAASGCQLAGSGTASLTINPIITPNTVFSYTSPVCSNVGNQSPNLAVGFTTGGTFNSSAGLSINNATGEINVAASTPGTYIVSYNVPAVGCQLTGSRSTSITILPTTNPVTGFSYSTPVCSQSGLQLPTFTSGFTTGGTFSSTSGLVIDASTGVIDPLNSTAGTYTITYAVASSGCRLAGSGTATITINPTITPVINFSYASPVCTNAGNQFPLLPAGFTTGGTFSSTPGLSIDPFTGEIDMPGSVAGTYTVNYSVNASGCQVSGSQTASITISASITPVTVFTYTSPVCSNGGNQLPTLGTGFVTGGIFSSSPGLIINSTTGAIDILNSTIGTYLITYSVGANGCQVAGSGNASLTISSLINPTINFSYASPVCANAGNQSPVLSPGFSPGGSFSSGAGLAINSSTGIIDPATSIPGTYTVNYSISAIGCQLSGSSSASITINPTVTPITTFNYNSPVCSNAGNQLPTLGTGFTSGGTFSSTPGLNIDAQTGEINVAGSISNTYTIIYSLAASGCQLSGSSATTLTISPTSNPVTTFSYTSPVCSNAGNQSPTLGSGFTTGGAFSSTAGLIIDPNTGVIDVAASTAGTYTVTYSVAASGCQLSGSSTANITINPTTNPTTTFSYTSPVCSNAGNQSPSLSTGFTAGGAFSSTAGLIIDPNTGVIDVAASTAGSYTVTYSVAASGCQLSGSSTTSITISSTITPVTTFSYTSPVCSNAGNQSPVLGTGFTAGGTFSSTAGLIIDSNTGLIDVAASTAGSYTITYSVAASGCQLSGSSTASITISSTITPVTTFSYTSPVCSNAGNQSPVLGTGFTAGGTFSSTAGLIIDSNTGVIDVAASTAGSYTITYSLAASGCQLSGSSATTLTISPTSNPVTTFSYTSPVCSNAGNQSPSLSTGFTAGGTFSSTAGLIIDPNTGVINVAASTAGSYTVTYSVAASGCQLSGSSTASITISSTITPVTTFSYTSPVCSNAGNQSPTLGSGFTNGGTFSSTAGLIIDSNTGLIDVAASTAGSYTITYSVAASGCQLSGSSTASITISSTITPVTTFSYTSPVCSNAGNQSPGLSTGFTAGGTFSSTAGLIIDPNTGVIDVAASTAGSYTITYSIAASGCQLSGSSTASITISSTITPVTTFSYTSPVCSNAGNQSPSLSTGFTTGGTFSSTAGLIIDPNTGVIDVAASTAGSYTITYSVAASGCQLSGSSTASITISSTITPVTTFSYTSPVCSNAGNQSPSLSTGFTAGGTFSSTAGLIIDPNTGVIDVAASTPNTYSVTYSVAASGCQISGSSTASITISSTITPVTTFSYTSPVCSNAGNQSPSLSTGFTSGGTFSSTAGLIIDPNTGVIDVAASTAGTYTVTYSVAASGCQLSGSSTASITISSTITPVTTFSYTSPVCSNAGNQSPTLGTGFTNGGTFSSTAGLIIDPNTGVIDVAASTAGSYTITYSVAASGCQLSGSSTASITISSTITPVTTFSYTSPVCSNAGNQSPVLGTGFTAGGTFSSTAGLIIDPNTGVIDVAASTAGSYTITYNVAASGCQLSGSSTASITISSNITPVTTFSYTSPVCSNAGNQSPSLSTGFTAGGTFSSTAGLIIDPNTGVINVAASTAGSYTVTYSVAASGCQLSGSSTASITISSTITPATTFSYTSPVCSNAGNQSPVLGTGFTAGGTFSSTAGLIIDSNTGVIDVAASTAGSYTVTYSVVASGCQLSGSSTASITISSTITPATTFSYTSPVCSNAGNQSPVLGTGFTAGGTFSSTAGLIIDPNTGVIDVAASTAGSYTITYSVAASGCQLSGSSTASITISSTITPVTTFSFSSPVCSNAGNQSPSLSTGFTAGGTFSSTAGLIIDPNTGVIDVAASTAGTYTVTYSVAASGCQLSGSSTASITISSTITPVTTFSYSSTVCSNAGNQSPSLLTGFTTGGTFSSTAGLIIDPNTGVIDVAASTAGTYTVTYSVAASGCQLSGSSTASITISSTITPVTTFSYTSPVCSNAGNQSPSLSTGFTSGGTFSSTAGLIIDPNTGVIDVAASTVGSYTITYSVAASGCQLSGSSTALITISSTITPVTTFSYTSPVCSNAGNQSPSLSTGFTAGGTFSSTAGLSINSNTGVIDVAASTAGSYTITYSVAASGCQLSGSSTASITISSTITPVTTFSYTSPVCSNAGNQSPILGTGFTNGGTFSSTAGLSINSNTGVINLSATIPQTYIVTYSVPASGCRLAGSSNANIQIIATPAAPAVTGATRCGPGMITISANAIGTITWYSDASLSNPVHTGSTYQPTLSSSTTYYLQAVNNGCTGPASPVSASILEVPTKPELGPAQSICPGDRIRLNAGQYTSYLWNDLSTASSLLVSLPGNYYVTVGNGTGCTQSDTVTIQPGQNCEDIYFPTAFTPNGDGQNDYFGPLGHTSAVSEYSLIIYNRFGEMVYRSVNVNERWNGQYKSVMTPNVNYTWYCQYRFRGGPIRQKKGNLVLIK